MSTGDHVFTCQSEPNMGARIVTADARQTWLPGSPVKPGRIWCWKHGHWQPVPEEWRKEEREFRGRVLAAWPAQQRQMAKGLGDKDFLWFTEVYCALHGWRVPDFDDGADVQRIIRKLTASPWGPLEGRRT